MTRFLQHLASCLLLLPLAGCGLFTSLPPESGIGERLEALRKMPPPQFDRQVEIYWSEEQIPFIVAQTDRDAAMALGIVSAHLRLGQMEIFKRAASGRLAELGGRRLTNIDAAIRALDFYGVSTEILHGMSPEALEWINGYVVGVNHYKYYLDVLPHDMVIGNMEREPWLAEDSIGIGRMLSFDISWMAMAALLPFREEEIWGDLFDSYISHGQDLAPSFPVELKEARGPRQDIELFTRLYSNMSRLGSNSLAVSAERSASGAPILSNEPHLGFTLPNLWMLAGVSSPTYKVVGMMVPGAPLFPLGRNMNVSWGGTNMRSFSSDVVDVTGEELTEVEHKLVRRFGRDTVVTNRRSEIGPVISDLELFEFPEGRDFALRWVGHLPSDELSAYLGVMSSSGWRELRSAMASYGSPGQNMLFADKDGTIGQISAGWLPARPPEPPTDLWTALFVSNLWWETMLKSEDLPSVISPASGVIGSANNPATSAPVTRMAWSYPRDDRIKRMYELVAEREKWDIEGLLSIHQDTYSLSHHRLNELIVEMAQELDLDKGGLAVVEALAGWDGHYSVDSKGAYVHIGVVEELVDELYDSLGREEQVPMWWTSTYLPGQLMVDLREAEGVDIDKILARALESVDDLARDKLVWGDVHRLRVGYIAQSLPVGGGKYHLYELPMPGGSETLMKSAHQLTADEHFAFYGSQSRHYSDMSDVDENYFVLYGGQDGWLNSENFADQVPLWAEGKMIRLPLRVETVREEFPHRMRFPGEHGRGIVFEEGTGKRLGTVEEVYGLDVVHQYEFDDGTTDSTAEDDVEASDGGQDGGGEKP